MSIKAANCVLNLWRGARTGIVKELVSNSISVTVLRACEFEFVAILIAAPWAFAGLQLTLQVNHTIYRLEALST